jgi:hypothetical protein
MTRSRHPEPLLERLARSEQSVRAQLGELLDRPCLYDPPALREAAALLAAAAELADVVRLLPASVLLASGHAAGVRLPPRSDQLSRAAGQPAVNAGVVYLADRAMRASQ